MTRTSASSPGWWRRRRRTASGSEAVTDNAAQLDAALNQIDLVLSRIASGDLDARIVSLNAPTRVKSLARHLNATMDLLEAFTRETQACLEASAQGRLYRVVLLRGMPGQFADGARAINSARDAMVGHEKVMAARDRERSHVATGVSAVSDQLNSVALDLGAAASALAETANRAVTDAGEALDTVNELERASQEIEAAVRVIASVAGQTRLLALNATIEAARAGESGKGFAVVASEVKNLANETSESSGEIDVQVRTAQEAARRAAVAISGITHAIREIDTQIGALADRIDGATGLTPLARSLTEQVRALEASPARPERP
ncbi:Methyl-accepting chemotaxis protein [Austwickia sp. TVS 96-490-7B]|uniref:methyl-accepting chemotaxis protein n=1 Tax=Austwickia sp. TVS 96-490-7B TaxID=2830843 RepID=UPI001D58BF78|nr:methyl-accepting chemotaxis protein [Austwickia sp. TVS 96-490-7B]MBW3085821.1 Methyl-accepting chemotaxis protein [Austwickia sp. TVS 96-490-7B]